MHPKYAQFTLHTSIQSLTNESTTIPHWLGTDSIAMYALCIAYTDIYACIKRVLTSQGVFQHSLLLTLCIYIYVIYTQSCKFCPHALCIASLYLRVRISDQCIYRCLSANSAASISTEISLYNSPGFYTFYRWYSSALRISCLMYLSYPDTLLCVRNLYIYTFCKSVYIYVGKLTFNISNKSISSILLINLGRKYRCSEQFFSQ